jgi:hypothetical protein
VAAGRGRVRLIAAGLAAAAILGGLIAAGVSVAPRLDVPTAFWPSQIETVAIDGRPLRVVRVGYNQGLREVETLGGLDGALFVLDHVADTDAGMGTFDTRMPLGVAFFDAAGRFITAIPRPCASRRTVPPSTRPDRGSSRSRPRRTTSPGSTSSSATRWVFSLRSPESPRGHLRGRL